MVAVVVDWSVTADSFPVLGKARRPGPVASRGRWRWRCGEIRQDCSEARGEQPPVPGLGAARLWKLPPRPGSELRNKARLACPSDAAAAGSGARLPGYCSGLADCGGSAMTVVMGPRRCAHWMVLLFCCLLLTFPWHGTDSIFFLSNLPLLSSSIMEVHLRLDKLL